MERIVPDNERVQTCQSFLTSRFPDRPVTPAIISRHTGLSLERVLAAMTVPVDRRPHVPARLPKPPGPVRMETLTCEVCASSWTREMTRGTKPRRCPSCR